MATLSYVQAINAAIAEEMERDARVVLYGEDVAMGMFGATVGLRDRFGAERVFDAPISEPMIVGSGVGAPPRAGVPPRAMPGGRAPRSPCRPRMAG